MEKDQQYIAPTVAERFLALSRVGTALMSERDEKRLLHLVTQTACDLIGAAFAAFSLRPANDRGQPSLPFEGPLFQLADIVGVTPEQEKFFRQIPLGGEGLLAPIFLYGVPVLVADVFEYLEMSFPSESAAEARNSTREAAKAYMQEGDLPASALPSPGVPDGHPVVRSFLGAPLLNQAGEVRGGLLLGHPEPGRFSEEDQTILVILASQAAVALENINLNRVARRRAQQLDTIFESIADGIILVDGQGEIQQENRVARLLRNELRATPESEQILNQLLDVPAQAALSGKRDERTVRVENLHKDLQMFRVTAQSLFTPSVAASSQPGELKEQKEDRTSEVAGAVVVWHDMTAQHLEAERAARAYSSQLEAIFEAMTDAVFVADREGNVTLTNTAARKHLSRITSENYISSPLSEHFKQLSPADKRAQPLSLEEWPTPRLLAGEVLTPDRAAETSMRTLDGQTLYTQITGGPLHDATGESEGAVIIVRDVTAGKRAEREREEQIQQLRLQAKLIELAHDAVLVRDPESRVLTWNRGAEELYGWTLEQARGQVTHALLQTHFLESLAEIEQRLARDGQWEGRLIHTRRDGSQVTVESRQILMRDEKGKPWAILEINRDITERLQMEEREREMLKEAEARQELLLLILDELPSGVYVVRGEEARLMLSNRAAEGVWGAQWPYDQPMEAFLAGHDIRLSNLAGHPLPPDMWATLRAVRVKETVRQHQEMIRRPDGSYLPVLVNAVPLGTTGRLPRLPAMFMDESQDDSEPLALIVHQDVAALKEAEALKDEFIGIAAHELRNPVAALAGFAQMLVSQTRRGRGPALVPWQMEALSEIELASARLVNLTQQLLDVTRLQAGRLQLQRNATDLVALAKRMVSQLQASTENLQLSLQTSTPQVMALVDRERIEQVLSNLLTNAIKYSPEGGAIEVHMQAKVEQQAIFISIRDHGIGIPQSQHALIFNRFMRASNAQEAGISGTGLGLYLCRELMEMHGGSIWFESAQGQGTTFFLLLPWNVEANLRN